MVCDNYLQFRVHSTVDWVTVLVLCVILFSEGDDCVDLTYWSNNQPDGNGDCVWLWYHDTIDNLLDDYPCSSNQKVACDLSSPLVADYVYGDRMALQQCSQDGNNHPIIYSESMTFAECKATCATLVADDGSPCVAVEWSDSGVDQSSDHEATCYFAWGCDDTISWSGGSVYMLEGATETCPAADMYGVNWHEFVCSLSIVYSSCAQLSYLRILIPFHLHCALSSSTRTCPPTPCCMNPTSCLTLARCP